MAESSFPGKMNVFFFKVLSACLYYDSSGFRVVECA